MWTVKSRKAALYVISTRFLRNNTALQPPTMGGDGEPVDSLLSNPLLTYSLDNIICYNHQMLDLILDHLQQPSDDINKHANDSQPPISFDDDSPSNACNIPSVFSPPPPTSNLKNHPHHPCDGCPGGWEFDDDINTDDITTIDNGSNNL